MTIALMTASPLSLVVAASPASAQEKSYDIKAQPLANAVLEYSRQSGIFVLAPMDLVKGKRSPAVRGSFSASEALVKLLAGSGLRAVRGDNGGMALVRSSAQGSDDGASQAPTRPQALVTKAPTSSVPGAVIDLRTGAALKGALVEIAETGETTSTGDLGDFRFPGKTGTYELRISYLGYPTQYQSVELKDGRATSSIILSDGSSTREIIVYGTRSARAQALNQERTADNVSTIVSSDQMGKFSGTTIAESLRRSPGVAFERAEETGDGANIVVRGMAPDFNTVKLNGIELPEATGTGRSASLGNILTESISQVTISKTLLPSQDSSGTGGLVEIETKSPLDRKRRFASFGIEGGKRGKGFSDDLLVSGTVSATFGAEDNFGISASVQYRSRKAESLRTDATFAYGEYLPLQVDGTPIPSMSFIDPRTSFPFEEGVDGFYPIGTNIKLSRTQSENFAYNLAAAWQISDHTRLKLDLSRFEQNSENSNQAFGINVESYYIIRPVVALGGDLRYALSYPDNRVSLQQSYGYEKNNSTSSVMVASGKTNLGRFDLDYSAGWTKGNSRRGGASMLISAEALLPPELLLPSAVDDVEGVILTPFARQQQSTFPFPLLNEAGFSLINDPSTYRFSSASNRPEFGSNSRWNADFKARYRFESSWLEYIEVGASYKRSKFTSGTPDQTTYAGIRDPLDNFQNPRFNLFNIPFSQNALGRIGQDTQISMISRRDMIAFLTTQLPELAIAYDPSDPAISDPANLVYARNFLRDARLDDTYTLERDLAAYLQAKIQIGKLDLIGGVRMTRLALEAANLSMPIYIRSDFTFDPDFEGQFDKIIAEKVTQTDILPRILANYRFDDNNVIRLGYYKSVARPQISLLSSRPNITLYMFPFFGPQGRQPFFGVSKGNPDLRPAVTHNFDVSLERYHEKIGVIKVGIFYKRIKNLLESNVSNSPADVIAAAGVLPDYPAFAAVLANPENYHLSVSLPANNPSPAHIWGVEASLERRFWALPGWLAGLGVFVNYTYTKSSKKQPVRWDYAPVVSASGAVTEYTTEQFVVENVPFAGQPNHTGTAALTYNKYGVDFTLAYTYQAARRQGSFSSYDLNLFEDAYDTLDARLSYTFEQTSGKPKIFVEAKDLLRSSEEASSNTSIRSLQSAYASQPAISRYFGGREVRVGFDLTF
ncbi:TonB-dependent receptor [Sphingopyxis sp. YR583]|uniref:TonB-dependent receptor n=1 Tax=Sphingopyxis sp. YR583 TaxID=1881047 RepID=UPI0015A5ED49|nr:TonB-dependent receptor [Sphingopyxis sp. YR583]